MTQLTKSELAAGSAELWAEWLRSALLAFTAPVPSYRRVRAFSPLYVDPDTTSPAGEIFDQIRTLVLAADSAAANGSIEVLRTWDPGLDGWQAAALSLQLATRLSGRNLYRATLVLIAKSIDLPLQAKRELAYLAVKAAAARFRRSEVEDLSRSLWQMDLLEPELAGELALIFAREDFGGLANLPKKITTTLPSLAAEPHEFRYAQAIAARLATAFPSDELARCLAPTSSDDNIQANLRNMIAEIAVPWAVSINTGGHIGAPAPNEEWSQEFEDRLNILDRLGDQVRENKVVQFDEYRTARQNRDR